MWVYLLLAIPLFSAGSLYCIKGWRPSTRVNIAASAATFLTAIILSIQVNQEGNLLLAHKWFYLDHFSILLILMITFVGLTTAIYSANYLRQARLSRTLSKKVLGHFYAVYQFFFFIALLILVSNNLGIIWVGMECATLSTVLLVSLTRTSQSLEAAWKYLILCGLGLAQALLGTILLFFATEQALNAHDALFISEIMKVASSLSHPIVSLAFVFILIGYGAKAGLVPLHNWLPDAYGESIAPVLALLSGVLLNLTLYTILRIKIIVDGALGTGFTGPFLIGFGLLNILVAALFLLRQREVKHLFAYSSIEHVGLICFAFGLGSPLAIFAGLLHMVSHALAKTSTFFAMGSALQLQGNILMNRMGQLIKHSPGVGWGLLLSCLALLGLPPFSLFMSELLIIFATIQQQVWFVLPLALGLLIAFAALIYRVQGMVFGPAEEPLLITKYPASIYPTYIHLIILLIIGLLVPVLLKTMLDPIIHLMRGVS